MRKIGNMATGGAIRGLLGLRRNSSLTATTRISLTAVAANRKSGIRIHAKSLEISTLRISNRKYIAISDRLFLRFLRFLIYGSAIKTDDPTRIVVLSDRRESKGFSQSTVPRLKLIASRGDSTTYEFLIGGKPGVVTPLATSH